MRKLLILFLCMPLLMLGQGKYHIIGEIHQLKNYKIVYLEYGLIGEERVDSTVVIDGKFEFKGEVIEPTYAQITIRNSNKVWDGLPQYMELYLCVGNTFIVSDQLDSKVLKGNELNETFAKYKSGKEPLQKWRREINFLEKDNQDLISKGLGNERAYDYTFLNSNPLNYFSYRLMQGLLSEETVLEFAEKYEKIKHLVVDEKYKTIFEDRLARYKNRAIGRDAIDFAFQSIDGEISKLSDLRGKYILLRFWYPDFGSNQDNYLKGVESLLEGHQKKDFTILRVALNADIFNSNLKKLVQVDPAKYVKDVCLNEENKSFVLEKYARYVNGYNVEDMFGRLLLDKDGKIIMAGVGMEQLNTYLQNL